MKGGTTPFLVSIQNQGTAWLNNVSLEVEYRGVVKNYIFNNLNPGETRSEKLFLDGSGELGKGVKISPSYDSVDRLISPRKIIPGSVRFPSD